MRVGEEEERRRNHRLPLSTMTPVTCCVYLAAALSVLQPVTSSDDAKLNFLSTKYKGRSKLEVIVNFTSPAFPRARMFALVKDRIKFISPRSKKFKENHGEMKFYLRSRDRLHANITFLMPDKNLTLLLHPFPAPPAEDCTVAIPDVHFEPEGDIVYSQNGDVSILVTSGVGRESVNEESLRCRSAIFTKEGEDFFTESEDCPLTIAQGVAEAGATYRLVFNDSAQNPAGGFLVMEVVNFYSLNPGGPQLIRGVKMEKMVEFYKEGGPRPVQEDTLAFLRQGTFARGRLTQVCDLDLVSSCAVTCSVIGPQASRVAITEGSDVHPMHNSVTTKKWGFLTVTSAPIPDIRFNHDHDFSCMTMIGEDRSTAMEQYIQVLVRQKPDIVEEVSSAVLHPDQTLEVKCKATGTPAPTLTITDPDDPDAIPLDERFPGESFPRVVQAGNVATMQYTLSKPSFTSNLSHVRCTADNGYKDPDSVLLVIGQA